MDHNKNNLVLIIILLLISCASHTVRPSLSEIERPLFLPNKYWQLATGAYVEKALSGNSYYSHLRNFNFKIDNETTWGPLGYLQCPAFTLNSKFDYAIPFMVRFHISRHVAIQDSIERVTGINAAFVNAITFLAYSQSSGMVIYTKHTVPVKILLSDKMWFESQPGVYGKFVFGTKTPYGNSGNDAKPIVEGYASLPLSVGYQIADRWSCKGSLQLVEYFERYKTKDNNVWAYSVNFTDVDIHIPIETKYVVNHTFEIAAMVGGVLYDTHNIGFQSGLWCTLTW